MARHRSPSWFARAVAKRPQHRDITVRGARVCYRAWGEPGLPGVVLVHGGAAHSGWWDHIAPCLVGSRVVAIDLSGHGDSDHRPEYDMRLWAHEVAAVAVAEDLRGPVVIGHSMGGWAAVTACIEHPSVFSAVAFIDTPLNEPLDEEQIRQRHRANKTYGRREEAAQRFAALPPQAVFLPYVRRHIVQQSLRAVEGGWTWKFDPRYFGRRLPFRELLPRLKCPAALLRSEHGLVPPHMGCEMQSLVTGRLSVIELPEAGHHPMIDHPLILVTALRSLLALWQ